MGGKNVALLGTVFGLIGFLWWLSTTTPDEGGAASTAGGVQNTAQNVPALNSSSLTTNTGADYPGVVGPSFSNIGAVNG